jgi:CheY-like chemotaxis protein
VSLPISHVQDEHPADKRKSGKPSAEPDTLELPSLADARILVVDDEADGRDLVVRVLSDQGAQCVGVDRARAALDLLEREHFDVLLSDIGMPEMDGYELIRHVRALDAARGKPLPAIAITAYARAEDREHSLLAGYAAHLTKPIEPRELVATVAGLLRLTR